MNAFLRRLLHAFFPEKYKGPAFIFTRMRTGKTVDVDGVCCSTCKNIFWVAHLHIDRPGAVRIAARSSRANSK